MAAPFLIEDVLGSRFVCGGLAEAEQLFGSPLPLFPTGELMAGREVFLVRFHHRLRPLLASFLRGALAQFGLQFLDLSPRAEVRARDLGEYEAALARALRAIHSTDRRLGLANLFWIATSNELAASLAEIERKNPQARRAKYAAQPMLSQFYRRVDQTVRRELERQAPEQVAFLTGGQENTSLIDAILDDGLALTEPSLAELDPATVLRENRRHRISPEAFAEIHGVLTREVERRLREGERGLLARVARHAPSVPREQVLTPAGSAKLALCGPLLTYLLGDAWGTAPQLAASPRLKAEAARLSPAGLVDAFLEFVAVLKRFELVAAIRGRVLTPQGEELEDKVRRGLRIFDFGEGAQVLNNAVNATVLFLDLRGFTKTSEGQISERDLTRELYTVFDAFVPHVLRFGGSVDKFLGDGMMIHYGTEFADPDASLNALRTAILCQHSLRRLRGEGRTEFKMGVSVHHGRVYLARFIAGDRETQNTVIGRNVNLAGRLSSAAKRPMEEDDVPGDAAPAVPVRASELLVTVDAEGVLFNEGIAVSRAAFVQIETRVELQEVEAGGERRLEFHDPEIRRRVRFRYVGDAKFKGVKASFPVFEVDFEE